MSSLDDRFTALESVLTSQSATLEAQQREIAELRDQLRDSARSTPSDPDPVAGPPPGSSSRRKLLTGGAAAAGAAVVGAVAVPRSAAAADGSNLVIGANNTSGGGNTRLLGNGASMLSGRNMLTVGDRNASSSFPAAVGAYGEGDQITNGVYAYAGDRDDTDTSTGHAIVAANIGGRSNLFLRPSSFSPLNDTYEHVRGSVRSDVSGHLWFCTNSGTPGTWRMLAGPASSGAVHAIDPARVYDSRLADGPLESPFNREVSIADAIDADTGSVTTFSIVPEDATAIYFNITIAQTVGRGFVSVGPGTATEISASTINWTADGEIAANGSLTTVSSDRTVRIFVGGEGQTHFLIDVTGYTL